MEKAFAPRLAEAAAVSTDRRQLDISLEDRR
jgi:hypothetical protein